MDNNFAKKLSFQACLGLGSFGIVFSAQSETPSQHCAIKLVCKDSTLSKREQLELDRESQLARRLPDHRNIVRVFDVVEKSYTPAELEKLWSSTLARTDEEDGRRALILAKANRHGSIRLMLFQMELCDNTLRHWLRDESTHQLNPDELHHAQFNILLNFAEGIKFLHRNNIIHRDIKPENAMFSVPQSPHGYAFPLKVGDFGFCRFFYKETQLSTLTSEVGTPYYMAPEVLRGKYGHQCDIYSFGLVAWEVAQLMPCNTRRAMFDALKNDQDYNTINEHTAFPGIKAAIISMTMRTTHERMESMDDFHISYNAPQRLMSDNVESAGSTTDSTTINRSGQVDGTTASGMLPRTNIPVAFQSHTDMDHPNDYLCRNHVRPQVRATSGEYPRNPQPSEVAGRTDILQEIKMLRNQLWHYVFGTTTTVCPIEDYVDSIVDKWITNDQQVSALELACQEGDPIKVQCILAFHPNLITHRVWKRNILPTISETANPCLMNVLNALFAESNIRASNPCCGNVAHKRIWLPGSQDPVLCRPSGGIPRRVPCRVLCIDGGGTRGLIAIIQLLQICDHSAMECFDLMVGTSTGALIILLLATGRSLKAILVLYFKMCKAIFKNKLGSKELEAMFKQYFGVKKMGDIPQHTKVLIATTTMRNHTFEARFITNFHDDCKNLYVRDVALRTMAAPGFIPPAYDREGTVCLDGGLRHNNPVVAALRNVIDLKDATVVSIGTGRFNQDVVPNHLNGVGVWMEFVKAFKRRATDSNGEVLENANHICNLREAYLFRLNPSLPEELSFYEIGYPKLVNAMWVAEAYANEYKEVFQEIRDRINP